LRKIGVPLKPIVHHPFLRRLLGLIRIAPDVMNQAIDQIVVEPLIPVRHKTEEIEIDDPLIEPFELIPTVSLLIIPLIYCHINSFQRVASVGKPLPGGEKKRDRWASHPVAW
jgi:hypothetical protein